MKRAVKILAATLALFMVLSLAACGKSASTGTRIFGKTDLSEYVTLGKYKGVTVDTKSEIYKAAYEQQLKSDVDNNDLYVKKYEGQVAEGDIANIDYVGKKNGVAFAGGTAQGHDLQIGSHSFIEGFEDGLIGVNIGDTVDLNLTFPENYHSEDLAGAAVVFTVKVNYVKTSGLPAEKDVYDKLGHKSEEAYKDDLKKRAVTKILMDGVMEESEVESVPEKDKEIFINAVYSRYDDYYTKNNNMSFEQVLKNNNMTVADFKAQMSGTAGEQLKQTMISYAILQKEGIKVDYKLKENEKVNQKTLDEITAARKTVENFVYKNAKIK